MSFIAKNPLSIPKIDYNPSTPPGTSGLFAKKDGWYTVDDNNGVDKVICDSDIRDRIAHYGDIDITPTPDYYFNFSYDESSGNVIVSASKFDENNRALTPEHMIIPYECSIGGVIRKINCVGNFGKSQNLKSVIIPSGVTTIGNGAFSGCQNLTSATIPKSLKTIGSTSFSASGIKDIYYEGTSEDWNIIDDKSIGWYFLDTIFHYECFNTAKKAARSATYYIGSIDTPNMDGLDYICNDADGYRFNDIINSIMNELHEDETRRGSRIVIRNGSYFINADINITQKCIMDFEKEFDISSEGSDYKWIVSTSNCIFNNFKLYGELYVYGDRNIFNSCWFVNNVNLGKNTTDSGDYNSFRFCTFNSVVQDGHAGAKYADAVTGKQNSFIGCQFDNELLLACEETIVKNCHFNSSEYGIRYNGKFPQNFIGYFAGNTIHTDDSLDAVLYDETTSKFDDITSIKAIINSLNTMSSGRVVTVSLPASKWVTSGSKQYSQVVSISGITEYSKVDLQPTPEQLAIFHEKDITFVTENEDGVVTVYCIGQKPSIDYEIQAMITEVQING